MEQRQNRVALFTFVSFLFAALAGTLYMVAPYLLSIIMGGILTLITFPIYSYLRRRKWGPKRASFVVTLGLTLLVIGPLSVFSFLAIKQGVTIVKSVSAKEDFSMDSIVNRVYSVGIAQSLLGDPESVKRQVRQTARNALNSASGAVIGIAALVPNLILQLLMMMLTVFFMLIDGKRFMAWLSNKVPLDADVRAKIIASFSNTAVSVIWAGLVVASVQAAVMTAAFLMLGVPAPFLAGGATFVFAWIPLLGTTPVWVAGTLYLYASGSLGKMAVMLGFGAFAGIIDNIVRPLVLKGRDEMHPLVSLIAIFGGVSLFGMFGVFVGPIIAAILISLLQIWPVVGGRLGMNFHPRSAEAILADVNRVPAPFDGAKDHGNAPRHRKDVSS